MKLAILGGGGFRTPLVYRALLGDTAERRIRHVTLYDIDANRLAAIDHVLSQMAEASADAPTVETTGDLHAALDGADFVFSAVRVGGLVGRVADERVALELGVLGQETTGPGGIAFGLRTIPVAVEVAELVRRLCPEAWVINFTNPAGMITEAMQSVLGERVIGICDSPMGLAERARRALGIDSAETAVIDYAGLNHLGWLQGLTVGGTDRLPDLVADADALATTEEGQLFGAEWLQTIGVVPNEYLYYFYFTRDALASIGASAETRGEFLLRQQGDFYRAVAAKPGTALDTWNRVRIERNATYMRETRGSEHDRDDADIEDGGYERVAVALMAAIARGEPAELILNVRNGHTLPGLPPDAVIEVPCHVDASGPRQLPVSPLAGARLGLVQQIKAVERLTIQASRERSSRLAVEAFALHPLVDSVTVARQLLAEYRRRIPTLKSAF